MRSFKQAVVVIMFVFDKTVPVPCEKRMQKASLGGYCSSQKDDPEGGELRTDV